MKIICQHFWMAVLFNASSLLRISVTLYNTDWNNHASLLVITYTNNSFCFLSLHSGLSRSTSMLSRSPMPLA